MRQETFEPYTKPFDRIIEKNDFAETRVAELFGKIFARKQTHFERGAVPAMEYGVLMNLE
jgi:glutamate mutase epsilon subunit